jgi:hypothetical protein
MTKMDMQVDIYMLTDGIDDCNGKIFYENNVISIGWKNRFYFPHPSVIKRCEKISTRVYQADLDDALRRI